MTTRDSSNPSRDSDVESKKISKTIYLDPDVNAAMVAHKAKDGVSFSFQVNRALRFYLGLTEKQDL